MKRIFCFLFGHRFCPVVLYNHGEHECKRCGWSDKIEIKRGKGRLVKVSHTKSQQASVSEDKK